jgi:hypothetical protein
VNGSKACFNALLGIVDRNDEHDIGPDERIRVLFVLVPVYQKTEERTDRRNDLYQDRDYDPCDPVEEGIQEISHELVHACFSSVSTGSFSPLSAVPVPETL